MGVFAQLEIPLEFRQQTVQYGSPSSTRTPIRVQVNEPYNMGVRAQLELPLEFR